MTEFLWPVRVYYEDTDSGGVVYYANYLKFMERARTEMFRTMGFEQDQLCESDKVLFVVRSVEMELMQPARFNEQLEVVTTITDVARTNITFQQNIRRSGETAIVCRGQIRVVCIDAQKWKPSAIPEKIKRELQA